MARLIRIGVTVSLVLVAAIVAITMSGIARVVVLGVLVVALLAHALLWLRSRSTGDRSESPTPDERSEQAHEVIDLTATDTATVTDLSDGDPSSEIVGYRVVLSDRPTRDRPGDAWLMWATDVLAEDPDAAHHQDGPTSPSNR